MAEWPQVVSSPCQVPLISPSRPLKALRWSPTAPKTVGRSSQGTFVDTRHPRWSIVVVNLLIRPSRAANTHCGASIDAASLRRKGSCEPSSTSAFLPASTCRVRTEE